MLTYLGEDTSVPYSLISLGESIPTSAYDPNSFGIRSIEAIYFVFTFAMPVAHLTVLLILWLIPMSPKVHSMITLINILQVQGRVYKISEVLNAWSGLDVFIVSILVALVEINQMAQFIIGNRCDQINAILEKYFSDALHGETTCFQVHTKLSDGTSVSVPSLTR